MAESDDHEWGQRAERTIDGYLLHLTCGQCPEQYDVYRDGKQVAYLRMRHGVFTATVPDAGGHEVFDSEMYGFRTGIYPQCDGMFHDGLERKFFLAEAIKAVDGYLNDGYVYDPRDVATLGEDSEK